MYQKDKTVKFDHPNVFFWANSVEPRQYYKKLCKSPEFIPLKFEKNVKYRYLTSFFDYS